MGITNKNKTNSSTTMFKTLALAVSVQAVRLTQEWTAAGQAAAQGDASAIKVPTAAELEGASTDLTNAAADAGLTISGDAATALVEGVATHLVSHGIDPAQ